jgi:hypothetical protein
MTYKVAIASRPPLTSAEAIHTAASKLAEIRFIFVAPDICVVKRDDPQRMQRASQRRFDVAKWRRDG